MAKKDDSKPSRVYKASDVHKRRAGRKAPSDGAVHEPPDAGAFAEGRPEGVEGAEGVEGVEGVVLTPQFGRRTAQQRAADDRWFAALRDEEPKAARSDGKAPAAPATSASVEPGAKDGFSSQVTAEIPAVAPEPATASATVAAPGPEAASAGKAPEAAGEGAPVADVEPEPVAAPAPAEPASAPHTRPSVARARTRARTRLAAGDAQPRRRVRVYVVAAIAVLVALAIALFTWNRWYRFDDHADLQGDWYVEGTTTPVAISEDQIVLTDDVAYRYEIDPQGKTIRYTFGPMEGQGRYWFSDDRRHLAITDGDDFTSAGTAFEDVLHEFSDLADRVSGTGLHLPEGEGVIAFSRAPALGAVVHDHAAAAAQAAAEESARREADSQPAE